MPVTTDSFLWETTGHSASGTSVVVTHPDAGGTTAGTTVVIAIYSGTTAISAAPAAFGAITGTFGPFVYAKSNVSAAETSWTFTLASSTSAAWYFVELDDVSLVEPWDGNGSTTGSAIANGATKGSGTVALNAGSSGVALAFFGCQKVGTTDVQSWSGYTNSFIERADFAPASGTAGRQIAAVYKLYSSLGSNTTTATFATSVGGTVTTAGTIVLLRSADASINAPVAFHTGFEFGTHAGMENNANGPLNAANGVLGAYGTNWLVQSGSARNGSYGLRVTDTAFESYVALPTVNGRGVSFGCNVRPVSGSGTVQVLRLTPIGGGGFELFLMYDFATNKFGVKWSSGSVEWQTGTTPLSTWAWVEMRASRNSSVHHADWFIETGTGDGFQTSPADLTGTAVATAHTPFLGTQLGVTRTAAFDYDDVIVTAYPAAYPLGPHVVRVLPPETTGATVSGTSSNFQRFTSNGTLANVNGTEGALLDDIPPTISASSDGVVQVTLAASDYIQIPMTTYTLASDEIIAGVRAFASLWGGTGTGTGTLGFRGHDGTTETTFVAASTSFDPDSLTTPSATYPQWYSGMWSGSASGRWNQTSLDAAVLRGGFSTDATPDMGFSCMGLEVATKTVTSQRLLTIGENDEFTVDAYVHTYNSAMVALTVTNSDPTLTAEMTYSVSGTPQTPVTVTPGNSTTVDIHADSFGDISDVKLTAT